MIRKIFWQHNQKVQVNKLSSGCKIDSGSGKILTVSPENSDQQTIFWCKKDSGSIIRKFRSTNQILAVKLDSGSGKNSGSIIRKFRLKNQILVQEQKIQVKKQILAINQILTVYSNSGSDFVSITKQSQLTNQVMVVQSGSQIQSGRIPKKSKFTNQILAKLDQIYWPTKRDKRPTIFYQI